jgi:hypothetical protein
MNIIYERKERMYETKFPGDKFLSSELSTLVEYLKKVTGKDASIEYVFIVSTDDVDLSSMLDSLADAARNGKKHKATKAEKAKFTGTMTNRSYRWADTGEIITSQELNKLLNSTDKVAPEFISLQGRVIENHKGERFVIEEMDGNLCKIKEPR